MGNHHGEAEDEQIPFWLEGAAGAGRHIVVTAAKRHWLDERLARQWRRPPTRAESDRVVADYVREEILYREALALGLDRTPPQRPSARLGETVLGTDEIQATSADVAP